MLGPWGLKGFRGGLSLGFKVSGLGLGLGVWAH